MQLNPVIAMLGRKLRLAVIGGGPGSFIGAMHRQSARLDDRYEIVTGILSSDPGKSKQAGTELGFAPDRLYANVTEMLDAESSARRWHRRCRHHDSKRQPLRIFRGRPGTRHRRDLRQAHDQHARRSQKITQQIRKPVSLLPNSQLHRIPNGPSAKAMVMDGQLVRFA